jgi:hypothetical protein
LSSCYIGDAVKEEVKDQEEKGKEKIRRISHVEAELLLKENDHKK